MPIVTITSPPENSMVCRGSEVIISCGYQSDTPLPVIWIINRILFTEDDIMNMSTTYRLNNPTTPNALSLTVVSIDDTTAFQCVVHSIVNTTSTPGTVTVTSTYVCLYVHSVV